MSSVAATVDISEQPRILEEVEENGDAGQPVNNEDAGRLVANEDAGPQSQSVRLDQTKKIMQDVLRVLANAERRHMANNIMPYETIRQIQSILDSFKTWGDVKWPMRYMRDQRLIYVRSLSIRYPRMESDEKIRLAKQVAYEAFKRHVESTNAAGLRKFNFLVTICELIEGNDTSEFFIGCSLFLPIGTITAEKLKEGWAEGHWPNYDLLRSRASTEAMFEMQTFVTITSPMTESAIAEHTRRFRESEPELLRADAAAAATAAAEAATAAAEAAAAAETDSWAAAAESQTVPETAAVES